MVSLASGEYLRGEAESVERLWVGQVNHEESELHIVRPRVVAQSVVSRGDWVPSAVKDALLDDVDVLQLGPVGFGKCVINDVVGVNCGCR